MPDKQIVRAGLPWGHIGKGSAFVSSDYICYSMFYVGKGGSPKPYHLVKPYLGASKLQQEVYPNVVIQIAPLKKKNIPKTFGDSSIFASYTLYLH
ncbi:hypothetical protein J6590_091408 [Homalodisca vitripennis]|nr:hypothetical protein J6590_091408 [Homalodisca vitripennis]